MAGEDISFGKLAVEKGYCSSTQLDDAVHTLNEVRKLGLDEQLGNILIKKRVLTREQVKDILRTQGQRSKINIGNYEILEKIGQGGMGSVFKARQISLDRVVALKILSPKLAADESFCQRFIKEARAVAKLSHPNIIVGIDVGKEGKYFYFAMEYVEGDTTLRMLRDRGPLPETEVLQIARQIVLALDHADKHHMVHRDIKPDNIMVTPRGEAKLCDLGLAKMAEPGADAPASSVAVGTPHYIAPEQARGEDNVAITADIYALGATLYHLATGKTLFQGEDSRQIMSQHLTEQAPSARKLRPELSDPFCRMLEKMMAKEARHRYQTPTELLQDMDAILARQPVRIQLPAEAASSVEPTPRTARRQDPGSTRSPSGRISTGVRVPIARPDPTTGPRSPIGPRAQASGAGSKPVAWIAGGVGAAILLIGLILAFSGGGDRPSPTRNRASAVETPPPQPKTQPADAVEVKNEAPPEKKPEPKETAPPKVPLAPPEKTGWEPYDTARQKRFEDPKNFAVLLDLFRKAEGGAPVDLIAQIRRDRSDLEREQFDEFKVYLNNRTREADLKLKTGQFAEALEMFNEGIFPDTVMSGAANEELSKTRARYEAATMAVFNGKVFPDLVNQFNQAGGDIKRLEDFRNNLKGLPHAYPVAQAKEQIAALDKKAKEKLDGQIASQAEDIEATYRAALQEVFGHARGNRLGAALACVDGALSNLGVARKYGTQLTIVKEDLATLEKMNQQAFQNLANKSGKDEIVEYRERGNTIKGQVLSSNKDAKAGPLIVLKDDKGVSKNLLVSHLSMEDLLRFAEMNPKSPQEHYDVGTASFWNNRAGLAHEELTQARKDKKLAPRTNFYFEMMEEHAAKLLERVHALGLEARKVSPGSKEETELKRSVKNAVSRLDREYPETEVMRARRKP